MHKFSPVTLRNIDRISTPENRDAIRAYYRKCIARGLAPSGLYSNIRFLCRLSDSLGKPFQEATLDDIEGEMIYINENGYTEGTKNMYGFFIKQLYGREDPRVSWIRVRRNMVSPKLPSEMITREELYRAVDIVTGRELKCECGNCRTCIHRDYVRRNMGYRPFPYLTRRQKQALLVFLYDSAIRPREFMALRRENITPDGEGMFVMIPAVKTETRTIYLVESREWLNDIPFGKLTYNGIKSFMYVLGKTIGKRFYMYLLRHSRITELGRDYRWTRMMLCKFAGWQQSSRMPDVYLHPGELSDLRDGMLNTCS